MISGEVRFARFEHEAMPFLDRLYSAATRMACDRADADDLVQQTYVQAFQAFDSFPEGIGPKVRLFRILADTALGARGERNRSCSVPGEQVPARSGHKVPAAQALGRLPDDEVSAALRRLPAEVRIVVHLADAEDFPAADIAGILRIPASTARSRLRHGRNLLLQALTDAVRRRGMPD
ncbi:sigma factor-like helix-turn-helix DNA-binding protein [Streptomyces sp. NPDC001070]